MVFKSKFIIKGLAKMESSSIEKQEKHKRTFLNQQLKTFCPCAVDDATKVISYFHFFGLVLIIFFCADIKIILVQK